MFDWAIPDDLFAEFSKIEQASSLLILSLFHSCYSFIWFPHSLPTLCSSCNRWLLATMNKCQFYSRPKLLNKILQPFTQEKGVVGGWV